MWAYESVFYQIYPLGFCGAPFENDGVLTHRIQKVNDWIPHIQKLGANAVYFSPLFESDTHGYNTRDYTKIDTRLGTNADFKEVCDNLHAAGIKVVLDGIFNHVGRGFWAFQDVLEKRWDSPYKDWFHISFDGNSNYNDGLWYEGWEGNYDLVKLNLHNEDPAGPWQSALTVHWTLNLDFVGGYLGYFLLGARLARLQKLPRRGTLWGVTAASFAVIAAGTFWLTSRTGVYDERIKSYLHLFTAVLAAALFLLARSYGEGRSSGRALTALSGLSLGVYLVHPMAIQFWQKAWTAWITPAVDTIPLQLGYYLAILLSCLVGVALLMSVKPLCWLFTGQSFSSACRVKPDNLTDAKYENKEYLMNAYDNTIRYTDGFLASLITLLQKTNSFSAMLYTSDHGEDIFDDNRKLFLHASPVPSYYQLHVPFLIWLSKTYREKNVEVHEAILQNREKPVAGNASVFHTMLNLAGVQTPYRADSLSVANRQYLIRPRYYLNDHNLPKSLDKIGLKKEDIEQFRRNNLVFP